MKKYLVVLITVVVVIAASLYFYGRSAKGPRSPAAGHPDPAAGPAGGAMATGAIAGEVVETMNSGGYTYVRVKTAGDEVWAAGPETPVSVGDKVAMPAGMRMEDFKSEALNRSFDTVYFVSEIRVGSAGTAARVPQGHPPLSSVPEGMDFSGIEPPDGGASIEAIYADKNELEGKVVIVRGKVVKFTPGVMGKNWIHLRDGTGTDGANDLTVTTDVSVSVGDMVTATGRVVLDQDFGFGYEYPVLVADAKVTIEK